MDGQDVEQVRVHINHIHKIPGNIIVTQTYPKSKILYNRRNHNPNYKVVPVLN